MRVGVKPVLLLFLEFNRVCTRSHMNHLFIYLSTYLLFPIFFYICTDCLADRYYLFTNMVLISWIAESFMTQQSHILNFRYRKRSLVWTLNPRCTTSLCPKNLNKLYKRTLFWFSSNKSAPCNIFDHPCYILSAASLWNFLHVG